MEVYYSRFLRICQIEVNKIVELIAMQLFLRDSILGVTPSDLQDRVLLDPFKSKEPPLQDREDEQSFPKVTQLFEYYTDIVLNLVQIIQGTQFMEKNNSPQYFFYAVFFIIIRPKR